MPPLLPPSIGGRLQHVESRRDGAPEVPDVCLRQSVARGRPAAPLPELQSELPERIKDAAPLPGMPVGTRSRPLAARARGDLDGALRTPAPMAGSFAPRRDVLTNRASCPESGVLRRSTCVSAILIVARCRRPSGPSTTQGLCARLPLSERLASPPSGHPHLRSVFEMRMSP
jgi:hypothetical protein